MSAVLQRKFDGKGPREGASWQAMENAGKRQVFTRNVGILLSLERAKAKQFLKDAEKEKQQGIQGQWQRESPAKEYLEQEKIVRTLIALPK